MLESLWVRVSSDSVLIFFSYHRHDRTSSTSCNVHDGVTRCRIMNLARTNDTCYWHCHVYISLPLFLFSLCVCVAYRLCFGLGVSTQVTLSSLSGSPAGSALSKAMTWGIGTGIGIWTSGGVSGGHLNPAITIALATHRGFPLWRIASYIFAQVLGGYVAALCIYGVYRHIITVTDPDLTMSSAAGWVTNPIAQVVEPATVGARISVFWNEVLGSALLMVSAFAAGDAHNSPPPEGMGPMLLLWSIMGILLSFSFLDGASLNPARDFGPRVRVFFTSFLPLLFSFSFPIPSTSLHEIGPHPLPLAPAGVASPASAYPWFHFIYIFLTWLTPW